MDVAETTVDAHNTWVVSYASHTCINDHNIELTAQVDGVMEYIGWAVGQNFGVMDINVPAYVTHEEVGTFGSVSDSYRFTD